MRVTWRKEPKETGLAGVCQRTQGVILKVDGNDVASVNPIYKNRGATGKWYFVA